MSIVNSRVGLRVQAHQPDLINIYDSTIGDATSIGAFTEIGGADIGQNCSISSYVKISKGSKIGNEVRVGHNSIIMAGAVIGNRVVVGNCCIISSGIHVEDDVIIEDGVYVRSNVGFGDRVTGEKVSYKEAFPIPSLSSDHPACKGHDGPKMTLMPVNTNEPVQLSFIDLFKISEDTTLSKTKACKKACMAEPKSDVSNPLGLDL